MHMILLCILCRHFGGNPTELPHPDVEWKSFENFIKQATSGNIWNPLRRRMEPWIDLSKLKSAYNPSGCVIS